jgi:hypothetical protein
MNQIKCSCGDYTWNEDGICDSCLEEDKDFLEDEDE